jgi:hypothetical protein
VTVTDDSALDHVKRQLRVIAILAGADGAGLAPIPARDLHIAAYFTDVLAPVWGLRILEAQLLKRRGGPMSPALQSDLDLLVGRGVVAAENVGYEEDEPGRWRLEASYRLNDDLARPILDAAETLPDIAHQLAFTREVLLALSVLDVAEIAEAPSSDATYGSLLVDFDDVLNVGDQSATVQVARRFGQLQPEIDLSAPEMIHLYVRALHEKLVRDA